MAKNKNPPKSKKKNPLPRAAENSLQIKSKKRVAKHGEVFTAEREVKAMCDLVAAECQRIDSRFLEPACGNGNFLAEILFRKLSFVRDRYKKNSFDYECNSLLALSSIYGIDILADNCNFCRTRLFEIWNSFYKKTCKKNCKKETQKAAIFILQKNIVLGNALSLKKVDQNQIDTAEPIIFTEWTFAHPSMLKRREFRLDVLLSCESENFKNQMPTLFDDENESQNFFELDKKTNEKIPKPLKEFSPVHYTNLAYESGEDESDFDFETKSIFDEGPFLFSEKEIQKCFHHKNAEAAYG